MLSPITYTLDFFLPLNESIFWKGQRKVINDAKLIFIIDVSDC